VAERDFLRETLRAYPAYASFALWRAVELRLLSQVDFPEPVLDIGCGEGGFARLMFGAGREITGLDLEQRELRLAAQAGAYRDIVRADATRLPFPDRTFASCLSNCVLEHIPDDVGVVREISRVLRPGAPMAITVPAPAIKDCLYLYHALLGQGRTGEAEDYLVQYDLRFQHLHYRTEDEWRGIFATAGLKVTQVTPYLPAPAVSVWDRLENYLMQPLAFIRSHWKLLGYALIPPPVRRALWHTYLRRYYLMDAAPGQPHGCWLIRAQKPD